MKKILPLILLALFFRVSPGAAGDILVVQSLQVKPYNEALRGFSSVCAGKTVKLNSSELKEADVVGKVRKVNPDLILAIGMDALAKVKGIRGVPIVYLMVLNPQSTLQDNGNITGVSMNIQPEKQLATLRQILPSARKLGLLFDPDKLGAFVKKAQSVAATMGIELLAKRVQSSRDAAAALDAMKGKIDVFWMLPDTTIVNSGTIDLLLLSAIENRIPVLTFAEKYAEKGALLSLEVDAAEAGRQAGEMANKIMAGTEVQKIGKEDARGSILTVNLIVAKKLGILIDIDVLKLANVIK
jgi:putative tryptophan/tyrosine transport system substrate-binding protein